jgi:hypothetical protein
VIIAVAVAHFADGYEGDAEAIVELGRDLGILD